MGNLYINQSMIKAFNKQGYCPMKLKKIYIDKTHSTIASKAMDRGVFFETLCLGSGVKGKQLYDLPRLKNGNKSVAQQRIELQAQKFPLILDAHRMKVLENDVYLEHEMEPGIFLCGTSDFKSPIWDDSEGMLDKAIIDLKLTANITSDFGPFCWHTPAKMDHTQAYMYTHLWEVVRGLRLPFYYLVFDYKPIPEYKMIKKLVGFMEINQLKDAIQRTLDKINFHESRGYFTNPLHENCKDCPLASVCPDVSAAKKIQTV